eukprot:10053545-Alexandrium_andersonii.AAC.1
MLLARSPAALLPPLACCVLANCPLPSARPRRAVEARLGPYRGPVLASGLRVGGFEEELT